jgi:hypothetical protein
VRDTLHFLLNRGFTRHHILFNIHALLYSRSVMQACMHSYSSWPSVTQFSHLNLWCALDVTALHLWKEAKSAVCVCLGVQWVEQSHAQAQDVLCTWSQLPPIDEQAPSGAQCPAHCHLPYWNVMAVSGGGMSTQQPPSYHWMVM